jgi:hypothetical protein
MPNDADPTVDNKVECSKSPEKLSGISWKVSQYGDVGMVGKYPKYVQKYSKLCNTQP